MTEVLRPTPEQTAAILAALSQAAEEEPQEEYEKIEITRGEFMNCLNAKRKELLEAWMEAQSVADEAQAGLVSCNLMEQQIRGLEDNDYVVRFFEQGNQVSFKAKVKGKMGFAHGQKREDED